MRLVAALLLIVGALAAVGFARHEDRIRQQDGLAAIASDLAGRNVAVHCPGFLSGLVDTLLETAVGQYPSVEVDRLRASLLEVIPNAAEELLLPLRDT